VPDIISGMEYEKIFETPASREFAQEKETPAMPAYENVLINTDITAVLAYKRPWPSEILVD